MAQPRRTRTTTDGSNNGMDANRIRRVTSLQDLTSPAIVNNMTRNMSVQDFRAPVDIDVAMTSNMPRVVSLKDLVSPALLEVVRTETPKTFTTTYTFGDSKQDLMQALDDVEDLLCPFD